MAIKVNFADAFLQSYGPGAQQGAAQWQAMQRQKAQEQQFQLERADAMAKYQQQQDLQNRQLASMDEYRKGQLAQDQAKVDAEQADVQTAAKGAQSLASGVVPNPRQRIADIAGMFKSSGPQEAFIKRETEALTAQEKKEAAGKLSLKIREGLGKPEIAGDPVLGGQMELIAQIAQDENADPIQLLKEADSVWEQAGVRRADLENQADYHSMFGANVQQQQAIADALEQTGDLEGAQSVRERIMSSRSAFGPAWIQPEKAGDAYKSASEILHPWRKGGASKQKEAEGPLTYREAYKAAQGGISAADVKALNQSMREAAVDEVLARGGSEEEAAKAAKKVRSVSLSEMHDREAERLIARDARDRKGPQQSAPQAPQQMNGAAQAPMQPQAQAQALPPAEFAKRKPEEQQGFLSEIEADLRDGGGTNLEAIYQKFGVLPGSLPPAVKARLKRAAGGG